MPVLSIRRSSLAIAACALIVGCLMMTERAGGPIERAVDPLRFAINQHDASGRVVIVEMDAQSAASIQRWPWPRRHYAGVVDALRRAGAASVVFDVDFSSASTPQDDAQFAAAIERSNGLVALPTFGQSASATEGRTLDSLPLPILRRHAALASVSIAPDGDGFVREMPFATITSEVPRPSLSSYIAARGGRADESFPIDFSIIPDSIPRASFVAVRDGRFDPTIVRGRNVLIGATAIEMGDRYAAPLRGILPGVVIQALAAETLLAGVPAKGSPILVLIASLILVMGVAACRRPVLMLCASGSALAVLCTSILVLQHSYGIYYPLAAGCLMILSAVGLCCLREVLSRFRAQRLVDDDTGLPNRRAFATAAVPQGAMVAIYQINNLDRISAVVGSEQIDQVVARIADRLKLSSLTGGVYRVRGQHLAFYLDREQQPEDSMAGLRAVLLQPVEVAGRRVDVAGTIGLSDGIAAGDALTDAALAAEEAFIEGVFWRRRSASGAALERSVTLMGELDAAIQAGELRVFYQPKLSLTVNQVTGVEALVRWFHPVHGPIPPDEFVGLAEQSDRIDALTLYVLDRVLSDMAEWQRQGVELSAAVNISAKLIASSTFNAAVKERLAGDLANARFLTFEVTESATLLDPAAAIAALRHYRSLGISVSLDDYGTGQSTLTYLRRLPITELKIDKSFVRDIHTRDADRLLVHSTIELAHNLGLKVVAEGVEDAACMDVLRDLGCDFVQGYLVSRPIPVERLMEFVVSDRASAAA